MLDATTQPGYVDRPLIELNGTSAGPTASGLVITASNVTVKGLAINRFGTGGGTADSGGSGILLQPPATNATIAGNFIGTDPTGNAASPNRADGITTNAGGHAIGNSVPFNNLISGNGRYGILVVPGGASPTGNTIIGNYIGTTRDGTAPLGNDADGISITAGSAGLVALNVLSGNGGYGISITGPVSGTQLSSNFVGTDPTGTGAVPNVAGGIGIAGPTASAVSSNTIAFNYGNGITMNAGTGNGLLSNSIFSNAGLGIDLASGSSFASEVIGFEDQPDVISPTTTPFPSSYHGMTWTNWLHYAPYPTLYRQHGVNAIFAAVDGARFTFGPRVFIGARFSRFAGAPGDVYFELYRSASLVWTSTVLADVPPQLTFLPSGYLGMVDEVRVRSLGSSMTASRGRLGDGRRVVRQRGQRERRRRFGHRREQPAELPGHYIGGQRRGDDNGSRHAEQHAEHADVHRVLLEPDVQRVRQWRGPHVPHVHAARHGCVRKRIVQPVGRSRDRIHHNNGYYHRGGPEHVGVLGVPGGDRRINCERRVSGTRRLFPTRPPARASATRARD